ncbi:DUF4190 domain-containing protein [Cellulomonas sp. NPDC055163]
MTQPPSAPAPYPYPYPPVSRPTNVLAVVTLVLALCGFAIIPVLTGHVALRQIRERGDGGSTAAVVGLVLGYLTFAALVVGLLLVTGVVVWGGRQ